MHNNVKTYILGIILFFLGIERIWCYVPANIWQGAVVSLIGLAFISSRWGLAKSWNGAYKVYVDKSKGNAFIKNIPAKS